MTKSFSLSASNLWLIVFCIVSIQMLKVSTIQAQSNLVPGTWSDFTNYYQALRTVFNEAYAPGVNLRVQTQTKYGVEIMTGIRSDSSGHALFQLVPEDNVWSSSYIDVPCTDSDGNELPAHPGTTLLIANKVSGAYYFELVDVSNVSDQRKVHVIPTLSIHGTIKMDQHFPGWQNYIMEPWDIVDIMTNSQNNQLHVFGYRDFTLKNENIKYDQDSVIIQFDGLFSRRDKREVLQIEGEHGWFSISELFQE